MKIILMSKCSLDIEQYVEFKMSVLIRPSESLISSRWVKNILCSQTKIPCFFTFPETEKQHFALKHKC